MAFLKDDFKIRVNNITKVDPDLIVPNADARQDDEEVDMYQVPHVVLCLTMGSSTDDDGDKVGIHIYLLIKVHPHKM